MKTGVFEPASVAASHQRKPGGGAESQLLRAGVIASALTLRGAPGYVSTRGRSARVRTGPPPAMAEGEELADDVTGESDGKLGVSELSAVEADAPEGVIRDGDALLARRRAMGERWLVATAGRALERWMLWACARPKLALGGLAALMVLAIGLSGALLRVDTDTSKMLSRDLAFQDDLQSLRESFPGLKNAIAVVVEGPSADAADAVAATLIERLSARDDLYASVFSASVDPFFLANGVLYGDMADVEARITALSGAATFLTLLRSDPTADTFLRTLVLAEQQAPETGASLESLESLYREAAAVFDAHARGDRRAFGWSGALNPGEDVGRAVRLVSLQPKLDFMRLNAAKAPLAHVQTVIAELPEPLTRDGRVSVTGEPALRADELNSVLSNIAVSLVISLIAVAFVLRWACRSTSSALLAFGSLLATLILTTGAAALLATPLNLVSVAFIVLMVGLGIDYAIHLLLHLQQDVGPRASPMRAIAASARTLGGPLFLSAATTTLSFFAFTTTDFVGMAQLGLIGGVGALIAFGVTATVIPAMAALSPTSIVAAQRQAAAKPPAPPSRGRGIFFAIIGAAIGALALAVAPSARFDADPMSLRDPDAPSVVAFERLFDSGLQSPYRLSVIAADAEQARATAEKLAALDGVKSARWLEDFVAQGQDDKLLLLDFALPSIEYAVSGEIEPAEDREPTALDEVIETFAGGGAPQQALSAALAAFAASDVADPAALEADLYQYFPAFIDRLSQMLEVGPHDQSDLPSALRDLFVGADGALRVEITPEADLRDPAALTDFIATVSAAEAHVTGAPVVIDAAAQTVTSAMLQATLLSLTAAALLAWAALGRLALVAAIIAPLIVAGAITAAASVVLQTPFNYANVIVLPLLIGIGVDSGVHLAMRGAALHDPRRRRLGGEDAADVFVTSTPRAVVFSAVTTIAAFGSLALSEHRGTSSMGVMLAVGLGAALFAVLTLTPLLVRLAFAQEADLRARTETAGREPPATSEPSEAGTMRGPGVATPRRAVATPPAAPKAKRADEPPTN